MVIFLALYPLALALGIAALDRLAPTGLVAFASSSPALVAAVCLVALAAVALAALRQRENPVLRGAWLFFFCGCLTLSLGYLLKPALQDDAGWLEEVFETLAFFPLLFYVLSVASPLRMIVLPRARQRLYTIGGAALFLIVAAAALGPWFFSAGGTAEHGTPEHILHLAQAGLDIVLIEPLALVLLLIGLTRGSSPYFLAGIGIALLIPEDIIGAFRLLRLGEIYGQYSHLLFLTSQLYVLNAALLAAFPRTPRAAAGDEG